MFLRRAPKPATTLHKRFEQQVELRPRAVALESDGVCLTYRELNQDANRMARRLVAAKVEADSVVLVAMQPSCELVVTLLAVLKAGGAFVILDTSLPPAQREAFIQASGADIVVTDTARPPSKSVRPLRYYAASGLDANLDQRTQADRWACMITGKVRSHEAVLDTLERARNEHRFAATDSMFSAVELNGHSVIDLFLPLIAGGRLVIASPAEMRSVDTIDVAMQAANCKLNRLPKTQPLSEMPPKTSAAHA